MNWEHLPHGFLIGLFAGLALFVYLERTEHKRITKRLDEIQNWLERHEKSWGGE